MSKKIPLEEVLRSIRKAAEAKLQWPKWKRDLPPITHSESKEAQR